MEKMDFMFDYEIPNTKTSIRTPMRIRLAGGIRKTSGKVIISKAFCEKNNLPWAEIAIQAKDKDNTFILFNPPKSAPRFHLIAVKGVKNVLNYSSTSAVKKMLSFFSNDESSFAELWLDSVGCFNESKVYRVRSLKETDKLYDF